MSRPLANNRAPTKDMYWFAHGGIEFNTDKCLNQREGEEENNDAASPPFRSLTDRKSLPDELKSPVYPNAVVDSSSSSGPSSLEMKEERSRNLEKRMAAEERRKQLWEAEQERNDAVLRKHLEREAALEARRNASRSNIAFAFGSSVPRNVESLSGGDSEKLNKNSNTSGLIQREENHETVYYRRSVSPFYGSGHRLEVDSPSPLPHSPQSHLNNERKTLSPPCWLVGSGALIGGDDVMSRSMTAAVPAPRGRRKNDLMPTLPYDRIPAPKTSSSCTTRKRSVSMTRLDQLAQPRKHYVDANKASSTVSSGASSLLKDTIKSPTRPLSSASEQSGHSGRLGSSAVRRVRSSPRKPRPVSIAGTVPDHRTSSEINTSSEKKSFHRKPHVEVKKTAPPLISKQLPAKPTEKSKPASRVTSTTKPAKQLTSTPKPTKQPLQPKSSSSPKTPASKKTVTNKKKADIMVSSQIASAEVAASQPQELAKSSSPPDSPPPESATYEASNTAKRIISEEEAKAALAEKRRLAREQAEREAELERQRQEELRQQEEERLRLEEEEQKRMEEEQLRLLEEHRKVEEEKLRKAIEENERKEEEDRLKREEELRLKAEQEKKAQEEAEKQRIELEEKLRKEEEERAERKKRLEKIMSRTRGKTTGSSPSGSVSGSEQLDSSENQQENLSSGANSLDSNAGAEVASGPTSLEAEQEKSEPVSDGASMEAHPTYEVASDNESLHDIVMPKSETASQDNSLVILSEKDDLKTEYLATSQLEDAVALVSETSQLENPVVAITKASQFDNVVASVTESSLEKDVAPVAKTSQFEDDVVPIAKSSQFEEDVTPLTQAPQLEDAVAPVTEVSQLEDAVAPVTEVSQLEDAVAPVTEVSQLEDAVALLTEVSQLEDAVAPLTEVSQLEDAVAPVTEVSQLEDAVAPVTEVSQLEDAVALLTEVSQLEDAVAPLTEVSQLEDAVAPLTEVSQLEDAVAPLTDTYRLEDAADFATEADQLEDPVIQDALLKIENIVPNADFSTSAAGIFEDKKMAPTETDKAVSDISDNNPVLLNESSKMIEDDVDGFKVNDVKVEVEAMVIPTSATSVETVPPAVVLEPEAVENSEVILPFENVIDEYSNDTADVILPDVGQPPEQAEAENQQNTHFSTSSDIKLPDPIYETTSDEGSVSSEKHQQDSSHFEFQEEQHHESQHMSDDVFAGKEIQHFDTSNFNPFENQNFENSSTSSLMAAYESQFDLGGIQENMYSYETSEGHRPNTTEQSEKIQEEAISSSKSSTLTSADVDVELDTKLYSDVIQNVDENKENMEGIYALQQSNPFSASDNEFDAFSNKENMQLIPDDASNDTPKTEILPENPNVNMNEILDEDNFFMQQKSIPEQTNIKNMSTFNESSIEGFESNVTFIKADGSNDCIGIVSSIDHDQISNDLVIKQCIQNEQLKSNFEYSSITDSEDSSLDSNLSQVMSGEVSEKNSVALINGSSESTAFINNPFSEPAMNGNSDLKSNGDHQFSDKEILSNGHKFETSSTEQSCDFVPTVDGKRISSVDHPSSNIFDNVDAVEFGKISPDPFLAKGSTNQISGNPFLLQDEQKQVLMTPDFFN